MATDSVGHYGGLKVVDTGTIWGFKLTGLTVYLSRCQTILRKSVLPGEMILGAGADSMKSLSPSIRKWRRCSVPFHSSFQETSTMVMKSSPSTRYLPLYASIDLCSAAL